MKDIYMNNANGSRRIARVRKSSVITALTQFLDEPGRLRLSARAFLTAELADLKMDNNVEARINAREAEEKRRENLYRVKPPLFSDTAPNDAFTLPAGHRWVVPGEIRIEGDKFFSRFKGKWMPTWNFGRKVFTSYRFCRPVGLPIQLFNPAPTLPADCQWLEVGEILRDGDLYAAAKGFRPTEFAGKDVRRPNTYCRPHCTVVTTTTACDNPAVVVNLRTETAANYPGCTYISFELVNRPNGLPPFSWHGYAKHSAALIELVKGARQRAGLYNPGLTRFCEAWARQ